METTVGNRLAARIPRWAGCASGTSHDTRPTLATIHLSALVERFALQEPTLLQGGYRETLVRREFVDRLSKVPGWDIDSESGYV